MTSPNDWLTHLDRKISSADLIKSYDPVTNRTTWTLPYRINGTMAIIAQGGESIDNEVPEVDAGVDVESVAGNDVVMVASVTDDDQPVIYELTYLWEQVSGPSTATISDTTILNPTISDLEEGEYVFKLTASDRQFSVSDTVTFTVASAFPDMSLVSLNNAINAMALSGDILYCVGAFTTVTDASGTVTRNAAAALDMTTGLWTSWNPNVSSQARNLLVVGSNIFISGQFATVGGVARPRVAKVDLAGDVVLAFDVGGSFGGGDVIHALASDGTYLYCGGSFSNGGKSHLARYDLTTGLQDSWAPAPNALVMDLQTDGSHIYAAGTFSTVAPAATGRLRMAKWATSGGALDATFVPDALGTTINRIDVSGSTILFGGSRSGSPPLLGEASKTTGAATAWAPSMALTNHQVFDIGLESGSAYVGGNFTTTAGGQPRAYLARINASTGLADAWICDMNNQVNYLLVHPDCVIIGGTFTSITTNGPITRSKIAFIDKTTAAPL